MEYSDRTDMPEAKIRFVLEHELVDPFVRSVCSDPIVSLKLSAAFVFAIEAEQVIFKLPIDDVFRKRKSKEYRLFIGYFKKIYLSSLFLLGSTDYLSAIVLMRSLFELLVGISTDLNAPMKEKIKSICFFDEQEKKEISNTWKLLCAWAHPYGKWEKYVCPKAFSAGRIYNPKLFEQCLEYSYKILDFMLTSIFELFDLSSSDFSDSETSIMHSELLMFYKRINKHDSTS